MQEHPEVRISVTRVVARVSIILIAFVSTRIIREASLKGGGLFPLVILILDDNYENQTIKRQGACCQD